MSNFTEKGVCPFGSKLQHYWDMRNDLLSRFDEGIQCDEEGLYSLKAQKSMEGIANEIKGDVIVDAFGGIGGASIAFALAGKDVFCIERDSKRLGYAKHNARIYGVREKIEFVAGDCIDCIPKLSFDSMYFDPPWVGEEFFTKRSEPPRSLAKKGIELLSLAESTSSSIGFTVPHNFNFNQLLSFNKDYYVRVDFMRKRLLYATFFMDFSRSQCME